MKFAELIAAQPLALRWSNYCNNNYHATFPGFITLLRGLVTDHTQVSARVTWCGNCGGCMDRATGHPDDERPLDRAGNLPSVICETCWSRFKVCYHCQRHVSRVYNTAYEFKICGGCANGGDFFHCRPCAVYALHRDQPRHAHEGDECCVSPAREFTFPHEGGELAQDTRVRIQMGEAGNVVTRQGITAIRQYLAATAKGLNPPDHLYDPTPRAGRLFNFAGSFNVGQEVKAKTGNFTTRLKRMAYKEYALKLDPEWLAAVGNLVNDHSGGDVFWVEVTRNLNLPREQFANGGSCYWTQWKKSRCALKTNGGIGLRTFPNGESAACDGRIWIFPLRLDVDGRLTPTFDTHTGIVFVFNGYGKLEERNGIRLVCHMMGQDHYQAVTIGGDNENGPMYINSSRGTLIGPAEIIEPYAHKNMVLAPPHHSTLFETEQAQTQKKGRKTHA